MSAKRADGDAALVQQQVQEVRRATRNMSRADRKRLQLAIEYGKRQHAKQRRASGEPYICHPLEVARIVAESGGQADSVIAAILHDTVEDTQATIEDIESRFGSEVATLVDGCTKVAEVRVSTPDAMEAARMRKLLVALARDPRVIVIKAADRLHNMRTIKALSQEKARRIGIETLAVHGPLAGRVGLTAIKAELEDLAFEAAHPKEYEEVKGELDDPRLQEVLRGALGTLDQHLESQRLYAKVSGRIKMPWSAYKKARQLNIPVRELHDLVGLRVIVSSVTECYIVLGAVHSLWPPAEGRFKDYIAQPKFNRYQSLHTSVVHPSGVLVEVQIRTQEMHDRAEHGTAAHRSYKNADPDEPAWLQRLLDHHDENDSDYIKSVARELGSDEEILVITPQGDTTILPSGSSVLDFAYAIHTDLGDSCSGAEVNGQPVDVSTTLKTGDRVRITTDPTLTPPPSWIDFCVTRRARTAIRSHRKRAMRRQHQAAGEAIVASATLGASPSIDGIGEQQEETLARLGRGEIEVADALAELGVRPEGPHATGATGRTLIEVEANDRHGLLAEVAGVIAQCGGDIVFSSTTNLGNGRCREIFEVTHPPGARDTVLNSTRQVAGVIRVATV